MPGIVKDLCDLSMLLEVNTLHSWAWCQPIGLLIPHPIQFTFLSNASYEGIGGWSPHFSLMWCITKAELCSLGFSMVVGLEPSAGDPATAIHINILEFIALCINVWFALAFCLHNNPLGTNHHIGNFLTNNTSALSWKAHVGRVHTLPTCHLTHFLQILLTFHPFISSFILTTYLATPTTQPISSCYQHPSNGSVYLLALPSTTCSIVCTARLHSQQQDHSLIHCKNDCTVDSHASHFTAWLGRVGYNDRSV